MKILITPLIPVPQTTAAYYLTLNLAYMFVTQGHAVAISADKENAFHHVSLYPAAKLRKPIQIKQTTLRSYEEWMYANGALQERYLEEDYTYVEHCIQKFNPDLIITMNRLSSIMLGRKMNIRVWSIVHSDMYKQVSFPPSCLRSVNKVLSNHDLEQQFHLKNLHAWCEKRIGFGPIEVQPFSQKDKVTRIGVTSIFPPHTSRTNRVCVFIQELQKKPETMKKMILDAFQGAPYSVYASYKGCRPETIQNIHFLRATKAELLPGSIACIHDGNDYFTNQCLSRGIQQIIITNHDYIRNSNAMAAERNHFGLAIYEEELSMAKLYEQYRLLLSDDKYYYYTQAMKKITLLEGDLTNLLNDL